MKKNINSEHGFVAAEAILGIGAFLLLSTLAITIILNIYNINLATHRNSMAINYAVEILENAKSLNYYDSKLKENKDGYLSKTEDSSSNTLMGVELAENYIAKLIIEDYNKIEGNEDKENVIKILTVNIEYFDNKKREDVGNENHLTKNIEISTLKLNSNF